MVVSRHTNYHNHAVFSDYNFWLLRKMRGHLKIVNEPKENIFVSRKGYRRGIQLEDELFASLQHLIPNLRRILPDNFTMAEQADIYANAKLIISPYGASLTNVIFSNWDDVTVIEFSPERDGYWEHFRKDLQVKRHYLMKCQSVPCEEDEDAMNNKVATFRNARLMLMRRSPQIQLLRSYQEPSPVNKISV